MNITMSNFEKFISGSWDYIADTKEHSGLWLRQEKMDVSGGKISKYEIDKLKEYLETRTLTISGLNQDMFEYFITTYGKQLRAVRFFKNKLVSDWSLLSELPKLEFVYFFHNQRIDSLCFMAIDIEGEATLLLMERLCSDKERPNLFVPTFRNNYSQMKLDGPKSHGKVFEDDRDRVWIWDEVEKILLKYKSSFFVEEERSNV